MGKTQSFSTVYEKNAKDEKVAIGVRTTDGKFFGGVRHPLDAKKAPAKVAPKKPAKVSTKTSTKSTKKRFSFGKK
jgi:hypothetical protein